MVRLRWPDLLFLIAVIAILPIALIWRALQRRLSLAGFILICMFACGAVVSVSSGLLRSELDGPDRERRRDLSGVVTFLAGVVVAIGYQKRSSDVAFSREIAREWWELRRLCVEGGIQIGQLGLLRDAIRATGGDPNMVLYARSQLPAAVGRAREVLAVASTAALSIHSRLRASAPSVAACVMRVHDRILELMSALSLDSLTEVKADLLHFRTQRALKAGSPEVDRMLSG